MRQVVEICYRYLVVIIFCFLFESIFNEFSENVFSNFIENILFATALISPLYFITSSRLKYFYFVLSFLFFLFCIYFETIYYYLFKTHFSSSAIFVALDSNADEALEFISFYLNHQVIIFTLVFIVIGIISLRNINKLNFNQVLFKRANMIKSIALIIGIVILLKLSVLIVYNLPYLILKSSVEYYAEAKKLGDYKENKTGNFNNPKRESNTEEKEVYVIVIGESTSRSHLGIYNYYRQTTPELEILEDELLIYNDVISPHAYSVAALTKILTLGNYENLDKIGDGSIIQLANSVGFETYWLSNQRPIGPYESLITKISLSANKHKFLTTTIAGISNVLDGELIEQLDEVLKNEIKKKVIFIHMMGTHHHYENRYPAEFNRFNDQPITKFKSEESYNKINHYHNAILYNDYLISQIIKKVDSLNNSSFVLYLSDHGEEMYDDLNMAGHNEDIYSEKMFEVPFFLWRSEKYELSKKVNFISDRKYMIDDLFHSISDLLSIKTEEVDLNRSIFSDSFKERKRVIKDTIDFDIFF